jgi:glycosyltransferase involved in cell wall biosynthesis
MKASVIICTYNRSSLLNDSVVSIINQDLPHIHYEIIVVDNNSSDNTRDVVMELIAASPVSLKYIIEPRQGLSFARNTGITEAIGELIVFTDDDIDADKCWLSEIVSAFETPNIACVGGPLRAVWPCEKPAWLTPKWQEYLAISEFNSVRETGQFQWPNYPFGANIAFRKEVFDEIGVFPTDLGRLGNCLLSNEETSLCKKIEKSGKMIAFAPNAVVHHKINRGRLTKQWFYHRSYWQGRSDAILDSEDSSTKYSRLQTISRNTLLYETKGESLDFDAKCIQRSVIGYLYQFLGDHREVKSFKNLKKLKTVISSFQKQASERDLQFLKSSSWKITAPLRWLFDVLRRRDSKPTAI